MIDEMKDALDVETFNKMQKKICIEHMGDCFNCPLFDRCADPNLAIKLPAEMKIAQFGCWKSVESTDNPWKQETVYIGVDVGKNGGYAMITPEGTIVKAYDSKQFVDDMWNYNGMDAFAVVEKVGAMHGQGVVSMFNFGKSAGYIEGVLEALSIPYQLVPPLKWKKEFSLDSDKQKSIDTARKLFPSINLKRTEKCSKDHDGMAEALLMAEYARRISRRHP